MINSLQAEYIKNLSTSFANTIDVLNKVGEGREERALVYGNGRPIYLSEDSLTHVTTQPEENIHNFQANMKLFSVSSKGYEYNEDVFTIDTSHAGTRVYFKDTLIGSKYKLAGGRYKTISSNTFFVLPKEVLTTPVYIKNVDDGVTEFNISYLEEKYALLDVLDMLIDTIVDDDFYGMTAAIGDTILNISHPLVLQGLFKNIKDPEELIFDNIWLYKYNKIPKVKNSLLVKWHGLYDNVKSILDDANKYKYKLQFNLDGNIVNLQETYNDNNYFTVIVPVQTAYLGHVSYPYYGLEQISIGEGYPDGVVFWPITSPNVDHYGSSDVCTGTTFKILEGVSMLFNGNFSSVHATPDREGTFRQGWVEAIQVMKYHTMSQLNEELDAGIRIPILPEVDVLQDIADSITSGNLSSTNLQKWNEIISIVGKDGTPDISINSRYLDRYISECNTHLRGYDLSSLTGTSRKVLETSQLVERVLNKIRERE